jgi:WD40 repeat protein
LKQFLHSSQIVLIQASRSASRLLDGRWGSQLNPPTATSGEFKKNRVKAARIARSAECSASAVVRLVRGQGVRVGLRHNGITRGMDQKHTFSASAAQGEGGAMKADSGAAAPDVTTANDAERVDGIKWRLATLRTHETELGVELSELQEAVDIKRVKAKRKAVRAEIKAAISELDSAVNAPVSGGRDPTEWVPDELMLMIMLMLPFATLWSGACERVCQRWARLMESASIVRRKRDGRWAAYETGVIKPRELEGHTSYVWALTIGLDGKVYSASIDKTIMVWSGESGAHLQTLTGHTDTVCALAVGLNGNIYSGSFDRTVRVWSGASGAHVRTLEGHTHWVLALAVGLNGKVYSGSADVTIRVWAADDGTHLQTLVGHTGWVRALAVGKDGAVYSGSSDNTIMVWSGVDGTHLRTLLGHTSDVIALAVAPDGRIYSAGDKTIRVWSPDNGAHLQILVGQTSSVYTLAVGTDGKVFSGSLDSTVRVWSGVNGALLYTVRCDNYNQALAIARDGTLFSGCGSTEVGVIEMW